MYSMTMAKLVVILVAAGCIACADDPSVISPTGMSAVFATSTGMADGLGPFLLEMPRRNNEPAIKGCAQAVNDEGMISGWSIVFFGISGGETVNGLTFWDRQGKASLRNYLADIAEEIRVVGMNNRGQILSVSQDRFAAGVKLHAPDGSYTTPLSPVYDFVAGPIRLDRTGNIMATYSRDDTCHQIPPCPAENWIDVTGRGKLVPPETPSYSPDFLPEADCNGEAIDDHGAVYGRCYRARSPHYRWVTGNDPTAFPSGTDNLGDVWIHEVNRYGELVGRTSAGPVYWSANTGRIQIPPAPGVGRLDPVSINDHGVVLLSSDYTEGVTKAASTIAYWTRTGGMKILPRKAWPNVQVHDINNRGTIVGCVGGEGKSQLVPAYWQIQ